jgi:phosphoesterase RecJ-like protein
MRFDDARHAAPAFAAALGAAQQPLVLTHINPDGDAIGAMLSVVRAFALRQVTASALIWPALRRSSGTLAGSDQIMCYQRGMPLPAADLVVLVDTASIARLGPIGEEHGAWLAARPMVLVDHHVTNDAGASLNLIDTGAASTCELLVQLFDAMGWALDADAATALLLGIVSDTQGFQTLATRPASLRAAADLIDRGASHQQVVTALHFSLPAATAALVGQALARMQYVDGVAWTVVTEAMFVATRTRPEDGGEVMQVLQRLAGLRACALLREHGATTRLSLRSRPPVDVSLLAARLGGGGHRQAAGATLALPLDEAVALVIPALRALVDATGAP